MKVYAAGVVCWRRDKGGIKFALVHREKYQDWGFAKGKLDPGEFLPETAVREVQEEAGFRVRLGRHLGVSSYPLDNGDEKEVHYWAAKVSDKALKKSQFEANEEIARIEWFGADEALQTLSYEHDRELLHKVVELESKAELETRAVIVLRHAKATLRADWKKGEDTRPLLPQGQAQAKRLVTLLGAYGPSTLITSSWRRCRETLEPYASKNNKTLVERSQLSELGSKNGPNRLRKLLRNLISDNKSAVICSHRPALPAIFSEFSRSVESRQLGEQLRNCHDLRPSEFVVLRISLGAKPKVLDLERVDWLAAE
jgi:8-oxo-dGTP diphosphatase